MPKNILIFSDGTGQRGGLFFDERRSNIYKLFRATRCAPDSTVDPAGQLTFYDPGIGTLPSGPGVIGTLWRRTYNLVSQALGLGLTGNIIDCYAAIVRLWRPGDCIFLFGFSRGAYTIRCLGGVIARCGVPTRMADGSPLKRDEASSKEIASEAVKRVYQHTSSRKDKEATPRQRQLLDQRRMLARRFRERYGSGDAEGPNVHPFFIGVFDTVASLANPVALFFLCVAAAVLIAIVSAFLWYIALSFGIFTSWWAWFLSLAIVTALVAKLANYVKRIRFEVGLEPRPWWRLFHFTAPRMKFYDTDLDPNVSFARHAISIDETRSSFQRVPWGTPGVWQRTGAGEPDWFQQLWFAGNHSDIGGSYAENESRLSDITLQWMLEAAASVGMKYDEAVLRLYPDPAGPQHDETKSSLFRFAEKQLRYIGEDYPLHGSVLRRFEAEEVLQYDLTKPYRPENLRQHAKVKHFYQ